MCSSTSVTAIPSNSRGVSLDPPELLPLLKDTIPLICASKRDTILFFLRAGVPAAWLADMIKQVETCRAGVTRFSIAHDVLEKLKVDRENHLRELREVVIRVAAFADFSTCGPTVRQKAMELVAEVRRVADVESEFGSQ